MMLRNAAFAAALLALIASPALADGDAGKGAKVFNKCKACHVIDKEQNRVGPHLVGIFGRPAASVASFDKKYSDELKEMGKNGLVWDEASLAKLLEDPTKFISKKTKMRVKVTDSEISDVIAYLKAESGK